MDSEPPSASIYLITLAILLACSMFFSASETALLSVNRLRIRFLSEKKNVQALRTKKLTAQKDRFLTAILIGNNIVNVTISSLLTALALNYFGDSGVGIATALSTLLILIFGEILPKSIALTRAEPLALKFSLLVLIFTKLFTPIIFFFNFFSRGLARLFGIKIQTDKGLVSEDDIKDLLETGEEEGLIESTENEMLKKIFKYTDLDVHDIMTPRTDIVAINKKASIQEILELSKKSSFSRFPVYGDNIDDILGILYIKDFLFSLQKNAKLDTFLDLIRPPFFCFEEQDVPTLQIEMHNKNQNIAIVIDEYGGTSGIVTNEDILEEIFGALEDEYDFFPNQKSLPQTKESYLNTLPGNTRLSELSERLGIQLVSEYYDTIGGFILEKTGDIPAPNFQIIEQGFIFTVLKVTNNRIETVSIIPSPTEAK